MCFSSVFNYGMEFVVLITDAVKAFLVGVGDRVQLVFWADINLIIGKAGTTAPDGRRDRQGG